jgi:acetyl esterase/lipase
VPRLRSLLSPFLAIGALLAGCSPLPIINDLVPSDTYTATRDIAYGDNPRQKLDVYVPAKPAGANVPVIVFFYGGNWTGGSRSDYKFAGEAFASQGFVAVLPDYRLYPEVKFPDFLHDSARAFAWARKHAAEFGGDPNNVFVAGHSAGAYNAAMLAYNPDYLRGVGLDSAIAVRGFIGMAGPYDFLPLNSDDLKAIFGYPDTSPATQPISFVPKTPGHALPPALILVAGQDKVVGPQNSEHMVPALRAAGGTVKEITYPDLDHPRLVGALAYPLRKHLGPVLEDIAAFVRQTAVK